MLLTNSSATSRSKNGARGSRAWIALLGLLAGAPGALAAAPTGNLMPEPAQTSFGTDRLDLTSDFSIGTTRPAGPRLREAIKRMTKVWSTRAANDVTATLTESGPATLLIDCAQETDAIPGPDVDESYALTIVGTHARLTAATDIGALRGLVTLTQLLTIDHGHPYLPAVSIQDAPRFPWRGLMLDVSRRWQPMEVIKRNLDGMELVKLNILHLHLTDDQGFRIESKTHPELQGLGSDHLYFTQAQIKEIIAYAAARGIRVIPEFDIPGHATSWVVSHPELASLPGPYQIERQWGVFDPVLDPTNEATYALLEDFLGEMAALFPDPYIHIGGDENNGNQWNANPAIQAFIKAHNLKDDAGLHAYFNQRVAAILAKHGKRIIGWDEILNPDLPKESVIDSWRGPEALADTAKLGFSGILANGFYIDLVYHTDDHYLNDPLPAGTTLSAEQQKRVLGGEATMWSEWVSPETIDSRIWPRTAAIAERLWSPATVRDVPDMYRRLAVVNNRLTEAGLRQDLNKAAMLAHFVGPNTPPDQVDALRTLISIIEPVKHYRRGGLQIWENQRMALLGLADAANPDSTAAREFATAVQTYLFGPERSATAGQSLAETLQRWSRASATVRTLAAKDAYPALREAKGPAANVILAATVGTAAISQLTHRIVPATETTRAQWSDLDKAAVADGSATELPFLPSLRLLVAAASEQPSRPTLEPAAWRAKVEAAAKPKDSP